MSKIINTRTKEVLADDPSQYIAGTVMDYFENNEMGCILWGHLSELVETFTGDAVTPFNTFAEAMQYIKGIENCNEETIILCVFANDIHYFILGWDYEDNVELWTKIVQKVLNNNDLQAIEC